MSSENGLSEQRRLSSDADGAPPPLKKKRNLPGNPDPESEVIALSPRTLLATNRFVCEICKKGFQRDQNLQLHRRGHNLPWKLRQRSAKEVVRKRVYVCPEISCVHHDPRRALGDLTGIKKHFCRKHGEKKWKCDRCSKKYAVQSDWKAHLKICGTRHYNCDCGTAFSRRDSFITHRAFCDALAEESVKASRERGPSGSLEQRRRWSEKKHRQKRKKKRKESENKQQTKHEGAAAAAEASSSSTGWPTVFTLCSASLCMNSCFFASASSAGGTSDAAPLSLSSSVRPHNKNNIIDIDSLPGLPFLYTNAKCGGGGGGGGAQISATALLQKAAVMGSTVSNSHSHSQSTSSASSASDSGGRDLSELTITRDFLGVTANALPLIPSASVCAGDKLDSSWQ